MRGATRGHDEPREPASHTDGVISAVRRFPARARPAKQGLLAKRGV